MQQTINMLNVRAYKPCMGVLHAPTRAHCSHAVVIPHVQPHLPSLRSLDGNVYAQPSCNAHKPMHRRSRVHTRHSPTALFTGIVQGKGTVVQLLQKDAFSSIRIRFPNGAMDGIKIGASVAINGTCLTVVEAQGDECQFDVIEETLRRTNLGALRQGSTVNYERSAKMGDEIGGHTVSGHVHCTAGICDIQQTDDNRRLQFTVPQQWTKYILEKGFVAVDGCSLTVGEVGDDWFSVYLIPETLRVTVLGDKTQGDSVNIEVEAQAQAIVDTVEKVVKRYLEAGAVPGRV